MSHADHEWAKEHIAAHLAGGLNAEERARLEAHAASCAECIAELDAARRFDRQMDELFTPVRAKAGMEERIIQKLRFQPAPSQRSAAGRILMAVAAVMLLGVLGYVIIEVDQGNSPLMALERASSAAPMAATMTPPEPLGVDPNSGLGASPAGGANYQGLSRSAASADELALARLEPEKLKELGGVDRLSRDRDKSRELRAFGGQSDHNESLDDRMSSLAAKAPGIGGGPGEGRRGASPEPAAAAPASVLALQEGQQKQVYSYRNNGPAQAPAEPNYFKPGDAPADAKALKGEMAKAEKVDEQLRKTAPRAGEFKERQAQQNGAQDKGGGGQGAGKDQAPQQADPQQPAQQFQRRVIRTGEVEYEIESFDTSVLTITKLVEEEAGFIATVNSDKLPNGKVRGVVVVRVPPERLDTLLLKLRGMGELKSQNIRSQDVGRQYYDLESRLRAARAMEERLLRIIKDGKGEIKDLLLAEKELGEWRTKIESYEGEKRYYDNQIGMSTITVTLTEKEIRSASAVTETERVQIGLEVEDVEKAHKAALAAVAEAKGRVTKSELKQLAAGQYSALVHFEVSPDAAGPLRDRFKQLGNVARLDIDRVQETEGGIKVLEALKVKQKDTQFFISIYNLANISPRETVVLAMAANDAEAAYKTILARIEKAGGRVVTSSLNRQKNDQTTGTLRFEIKSAEADAVLLDIRAAGEVMRLDVTENPDTQNVTKSKKGFQVQIFAMGLVDPRETTTITIASKDVPAAYKALQDALAAADARVSNAQLNENDRQNVSASLFFDYRRDNDAKIQAALAASGEVLTRSSVRAQDNDRTVDSKKRLNLTVINLSTIPPRDTFVIAVEVEPVDAAVSAVEALAAELKGRVIESRDTTGSNGRHNSKFTIDLPLSAARGAADKIKRMGTLRVFDTLRNAQAPEGELAVGRLDVTISNPSQLVDAESGPWTRIKSGLSVGLTALSWSLTLVIVGLCFVVPVGLIGWLGMRIYRRTKVKPA